MEPSDEGNTYVSSTRIYRCTKRRTQGYRRELGEKVLATAFSAPSTVPYSKIKEHVRLVHDSRSTLSRIRADPPLEVNLVCSVRMLGSDQHRDSL